MSYFRSKHRSLYMLKLVRTCRESSKNIYLLNKPTPVVIKIYIDNKQLEGFYVNCCQIVNPQSDCKQADSSWSDHSNRIGFVYVLNVLTEVTMEYLIGAAIISELNKLCRKISPYNISTNSVIDYPTNYTTRLINLIEPLCPATVTLCIPTACMQPVMLYRYDVCGAFLPVEFDVKIDIQQLSYCLSLFSFEELDWCQKVSKLAYLTIIQ